MKRARRLGEATALRDQLQLIVDTIPAMVWSNLPDGSTEFLNKRFRDYAGIAAEERQGSAWMNILHPDDRTAMDWHGALAAGAAVRKGSALALRPTGNTVAFCYALSRCATGKAYCQMVRKEHRYRGSAACRGGIASTRGPLARRAGSPAHANRVTTTGQLAASIAHEVSQPISASPHQRQCGAALAGRRAARSGRGPPRHLTGSSGTVDEPVTSSAGFERSSEKHHHGTIS